MWYSSHVLSCPYHLQGQEGRRTCEGPFGPPNLPPSSPEVQRGHQSSEREGLAKATQPGWNTCHPRATTNLSLYLRE